MKVESSINALSAETLALQTLFAELCHGLIGRDPVFRSVISDVFDHAANHLENIAISVGNKASPEHTVKAIQIVEELRTVVLGNMQKPRGPV